MYMNQQLFQHHYVDCLFYSNIYIFKYTCLYAWAIKMIHRINNALLSLGYEK